MSKLVNIDWLLAGGYSYIHSYFNSIYTLLLNVCVSFRTRTVFMASYINALQW